MAYNEPIVPVASGGTGNQTFPNLNSVLFTGTTATGNLQAPATGAAGTVLTSNGANVLPTWQSGSASGNNPVAFLGYVGTSVPNATGNGTTYQLGTDALTKAFDVGGNLNTNGTFTAPITGKYQLGVEVTVANLTVATTFIVTIRTTARNYNYQFTKAAGNQTESVSCNVLADMNAGDTATAAIQVSGEVADTATINGFASSTSNSFFYGSLSTAGVGGSAFIQPALNASTSAPTGGVTGNGAVYSIVCDSVQFDQTGSYNNTTGIFTVPRDGVYFVFTRVPVGSVTAAMTNGGIGVSGTFTPLYLIDNPGAIKDNNNICDYQFTYVQKYTTGDTIQPFIALNNGAGNTATVEGGATFIVVYLGPFGGGGDVVGPASAVDGDIVLFDGTSGKLIKDSGAKIATGTFTPTLEFGGASTGITYSAQLGEYTQIGNVIYFTSHITLTNKGSSTGVATMVLTGLPISGGTGTTNSAVGLNITFDAGRSYMTGVSNPGLNAVSFEQWGSGLGAATQSMNDTNFANNSDFTVSGFYFTS